MIAHTRTQQILAEEKLNLKFIGSEILNLFGEKVLKASKSLACCSISYIMPVLDSFMST